MSNTEAWDEIAARRGEATALDAVQYAPDLPTDNDLRLIGDVRNKRVLDLGCGSGENALTLAAQGAHVIGVDSSRGQLALGKALGARLEVKVEWHAGDASDLAFLRADSIDIALAIGLIGEVEDVDRLFRQVHRVLRPGAAFVFSYDHPAALALARDDAPGTLPLGGREVKRSYFELDAVEITHGDSRVKVWPRTIAEVFAALHRAGYRADALLEPQPVRSSDPGPPMPTGVIWRARKEGV